MNKRKEQRKSFLKENQQKKRHAKAEGRRKNIDYDDNNVSRYINR